MRCFWEQVGLLAPIYHLVGRGMSDPDIAKNLGVSALSVQGCIAWMLHFFKLTSRQELVLRASNL
jgi:DNA-binding CsgD family transcriptional regulator